MGTMPRITRGSTVCTVIVTVDAAPQILADLVVHAQLGIDRFVDFQGYLGGALHLSEDGGRLVQYLQWASETDYLACINDPVWDELESAKSFLAAVESGAVRLDSRIFEVRAVSEGRDVNRAVS
jgi:hypothetical protein